MTLPPVGCCVNRQEQHSIFLLFSITEPSYTACFVRLYQRYCYAGSTVGPENDPDLQVLAHAPEDEEPGLKVDTTG